MPARSCCRYPPFPGMGADHDQAIRWAEVLRQTERLLTQSALANDAITAWSTQLTPEQRAVARGLIEQYEALDHQAVDVLTTVLSCTDRSRIRRLHLLAAASRRVRAPAPVGKPSP